MYAAATKDGATPQMGFFSSLSGPARALDAYEGQVSQKGVPDCAALFRV